MYPMLMFQIKTTMRNQGSPWCNTRNYVTAPLFLCLSCVLQYPCKRHNDHYVFVLCSTVPVYTSQWSLCVCPVLLYPCGHHNEHCVCPVLQFSRVRVETGSGVRPSCPSCRPPPTSAAAPVTPWIRIPRLASIFKTKYFFTHASLLIVS